MLPQTTVALEGKDAEKYLNRLTVRDVSALKPGSAQYTAWCDDEGYVLDDGMLFRLAEDRFRLCSQEFHLPWLLDSAFGFDVEVADQSAETAGLSLQGPTSAAILREVGFEDVGSLAPFAVREIDRDGGKLALSRTGFTGDLGYELFMPAGMAQDAWDLLWKAGEARGITAVGYDAINTARIEAGMLVANHDFMTAETAVRADRRRSPDEIGLGWMVAHAKEHFNGKRAIDARRCSGGFTHSLHGIELEGREPAEGAVVYSDRRIEAGLITSCVWSPMRKRPVGIASFMLPYGAEETENLWAENYVMKELQYSKLMVPVRIVKRPFVKLERRTALPPADF